MLGRFAPPDVLKIITDQIAKISRQRSWRHPDVRVPADALEQFGRDGVDHHDAQRRVRHHRGTAAVEGAADRHRADGRHGVLHPRVDGTGAGRADARASTSRTRCAWAPRSSGPGGSCSGRSCSRLSRRQSASSTTSPRMRSRTGSGSRRDRSSRRCCGSSCRSRFKLYIAYFGNYNETYGTLGAFIVLLTWFYLSGLAILVGAELNAEIEHASPYGKDVGEKVPGEKKKIGPAARGTTRSARAKGRARVPPFPDDVNCDLDRGMPRKAPAVRPSELLIGAAALLPAAIKIGTRSRRRRATDPGRERCVRLTSAATRQVAACRQSPSTPAPPLCRGLSTRRDGLGHRHRRRDPAGGVRPGCRPGRPPELP